MRFFTLSPKPPFRLDLTAWALRRLPINLIDRWDNGEYRRVLTLNGTPAEVSVSQIGTSEKPKLVIKVKAKRDDMIKRQEVISVLKKILGMEVNLTEFFHLACRDKRLFFLLSRFDGLKPPRFASVFEALINGFACQQLSLHVGIHLLNRLCVKYGLKFGESRAFPRPVDLSDAKHGDLMKLGFSRNKAEYILNAAITAVKEKWVAEQFGELSAAAALEKLLEIRGVGMWTAEYVLLRGLGKLDVIPADDVGIRNKLAYWLGLKTVPDPDSVRKILSRWNSYKGALYFYLLLDYLERTGKIDNSNFQAQ